MGSSGLPRVKKKEKTQNDTDKKELNNPKEFICTFKFEKKYIYGFLCDFKYLGHTYSLPTIITYIDFFKEDFNFNNEIKNITIGNNSKKTYNINLKKKFIFYEYNIVILEILNNYKGFSYLQIDNNFSENKNNSSYLCLFIEQKIKTFKNLNLIDLDGDIFDCHGINKKALLLNQNNEIIGIIGNIMGKNSFKGILINGILKKIKDNKKQDYKNQDINNSNSNNQANTYKKKYNQANTYKKNNNASNYENNAKKGNFITIDNKKGKKNKEIKNKENENTEKIIKFATIEETEISVKKKKKNNDLNIDNGGFKKENDSEINLLFLFNNGKELYLDVKESCKFDQVIKQLNEKYLWLKNISIQEYQFKNNKISENITVKENKLEDNSTINIIECS